MDSTELFDRHPSGPILQAKDIPLPCQAVCNPAACIVGGETLLLLRVVGPDNQSNLLVARSRDGVSDWRFDPQPLLGPMTDPAWYEALGAEDPRIVFLPERGEYVITYVGNSRFGAGVCIATTRDFRTAERLGLVIHPYNKDAALFPRRINSRYYLLHRPTAGPLENIWMAQSDNLRAWDSPQCVLEEDDQPGWDSGKVGAGPPPIETPQGWLLLFHGVQQQENGWLYRMGLALLDLDNPGKVIARCPSWVFEPRAPYEMIPNKPGIIFPTGAIVRDDIVHLYYGAADSSVALATAPLPRLMEALEQYRAKD